MDTATSAFIAFGPALAPYVALIVLGFLPSEMWRVFGVFISRGLADGSPVLDWVRLVATALLAGVVARLLLSPNGMLASIPMSGRIGAMGVALAAYVLFRRSVLAGVLAGEAALIAMGYYTLR